MPLQRLSTGKLLKITGGLAKECCCETYDCSENLTYYGYIINATFDGFTGCLVDLEGDNELEATVSSLGDEAPGANWYPKTNLINPSWQQEPCRWGWTDGINHFSIEITLYYNIVTLAERWFLRAISNPSGGYIAKWWYKTHVDGVKSDLFGTYTDYTCGASGICSCASEAGATCIVSSN